MRILLACALALAGCAAHAGRSAPSAFEQSFERMGPPRRGDWLAVHPEPRQSFDAYAASHPNRRTETRNRIYIVPLGRVAESEPALLENLAEFLAIFFGMPVSLAGARPVPAGAMHHKRKQLDAGILLSRLADDLPPDAAACVGFLELDLYYAGLNYVFGLGAFDARRSGVYSIARYRFEYIGQAETVTLLRRTLKVAIHEICHIFGLHHCKTWRCAMNGSNSIMESDRRPMFLCPQCLEKLRWNLGFDPALRYRKLASFYGKFPEFRAEAKRARILAETWERSTREGREK
jgi:archaemetzincin